jgi:type IV pilus biogenesis protein CpaD/CtpE|eukprot:252612-Prymnesium_polylepis.2
MQLERCRAFVAFGSGSHREADLPIIKLSEHLTEADSETVRAFISSSLSSRETMTRSIAHAAGYTGR